MSQIDVHTKIKKFDESETKKLLNAEKDSFTNCAFKGERFSLLISNLYCSCKQFGLYLWVVSFHFWS